MSVRLCKWGNSTGLRLPASVLAAAGLKQGDAVYVRLLDSGDIRVRPAHAVKPVELKADADSGLSEEEKIAKYW